jgi:hypothetical protein
MYNYAMRPGLWLILLAAFAYADPPKIDLPATQPPPDNAAASPSEAISVVTPDDTNRDWQFYDNRIVKAHAHVKTAWTVMEIKETKDSGSVSFTLSRLPLVTFSITREPLAAPFEEYVSSSSLTSLYPTGFEEGHSTLAGRKALLVKGKSSDGRWDESYFVPGTGFYTQVSFTMPKEAQKDFQNSFAALKDSFRWQP